MAPAEVVGRQQWWQAGEELVSRRVSAYNCRRHATLYVLSMLSCAPLSGAHVCTAATQAHNSGIEELTQATHQRHAQEQAHVDAQKRHEELMFSRNRLVHPCERVSD